MPDINKLSPAPSSDDFPQSIQELESLSTDELQQRIDALKPAYNEFSYSMAYMAARKVVENSSLQEEVTKLHGDLDTAKQTIQQHEGTIKDLSDIGFRQNMNARLANQAATTDSLTGLPNRLGFFQRAEEILTKAKDPENYAVAVMDANNLKLLNDEEGHDVGDEGIISAAKYAAAAKYLEGKVRQGDLVAIGRIGGDEIFALFHLVPNDPKYNSGQVFQQSPEEREERARAIVTRLTEGFEKDVVSKNDKLVKSRFGLSCGIAVGGSGKDLVTLIQEADMLMYESKKVQQAVNGKSR